MRTLGIWTFGIIGCAVAGGMIGDLIKPYGGGDLGGAIVGICAFSCLRLWVAPRKPQSPE